jgi:hypothetical protein
MDRKTGAIRTLSRIGKIKLALLIQGFFMFTVVHTSPHEACGMRGFLLMDASCSPCYATLHTGDYLLYFLLKNLRSTALPMIYTAPMKTKGAKSNMTGSLGKKRIANIKTTKQPIKTPANAK